MSETWILGPCGIDNVEMYIDTCRFLHPLMKGKDWYYKASFDKANRTSINGERCVGIETGIKAFEQVKSMFPDVRLVTDVHECYQVEQLAHVIDVVQIPAFLCRQTDLIVECARHFNTVNIKKGQWIGPNNLVASVDKIRHTNSECRAWITDRGSNFGYDKLIVDFGIVDELKKSYDKVILDCTHSTQRSRSVYGKQGDVELAKRYFLSAPIFEYDGVFAETHPNPQESCSDKECQIPLDEMIDLLAEQRIISHANDKRISI